MFGICWHHDHHENVQVVLGRVNPPSCKVGGIMHESQERAIRQKCCKCNRVRYYQAGYDFYGYLNDVLREVER